MSFLDKLKNKTSESQLNTKEVIADENKDKKAEGFMQLDVDIYQTSSEIIIIAPIAGVEVKDLDISIENDNDVVVIQGERIMPIEITEKNIDKKNLRLECQWGAFYRQIILPQEINVAEVEAKFKKGILILTLPLLRLQTGGKKKILVNLDK